MLKERIEKYLPHKSSKKDFHIGLIYKRFAFLKMLEHHKKQQKNHEQFLWGNKQPSNVNSNTTVNPKSFKSKFKDTNYNNNEALYD